jgi:hypothetical protein
MALALGLRLDGIRFSAEFATANRTTDFGFMTVQKGHIAGIAGDPDVRLKLESPDGHLDGAVTTAMPCVNAIPAVCAAPPGIVNQADLPFVRGAHLIR